MCNVSDTSSLARESRGWTEGGSSLPYDSDSVANHRPVKLMGTSEVLTKLVRWPYATAAWNMSYGLEAELDANGFGWGGREKGRIVPDGLLGHNPIKSAVVSMRSPAYRAGM